MEQEYLGVEAMVHEFFRSTVSLGRASIMPALRATVPGHHRSPSRSVSHLSWASGSRCILEERHLTLPPRVENRLDNPP
jgi:hypothetical protein